ncbi:Asp23/Gls24 family envelope stress response protein, partial [Streptomyces hokutonensis]|uniref:Asp23/Gls24 family envelope stress response protein n=1 Tax=Streptomyces hokutonensis TaxID=1306990 RepID=UPI003690D51F
MTTAAQRGTTTLSDKAVRKIAERSAAEVLAGRGATAVRGIAKGSARVRGRRADVAVDVALPYPAPVAEEVRRLQDHVGSRTRQLTGLDVARPRVGVTALNPLPADSTATAQKGTPAHVPTAATSGTRTPWRWWSQRRLPMTLVTLAAAVAAGALAFDMAMVHTAHRPPAAWRTGALHWLAEHGPGEPAVVVGSGAVAVLGLLLIVLALTPGHRGLLTVACDPRMGAAVDRRGRAAHGRGAGGATAGLRAVTVRGRRDPRAGRAH